MKKLTTLAIFAGVLTVPAVANADTINGTQVVSNDGHTITLADGSEAHIDGNHAYTESGEVILTPTIEPEAIPNQEAPQPQATPTQELQAPAPTPQATPQPQAVPQAPEQATPTKAPSDPIAPAEPKTPDAPTQATPTKTPSDPIAPDTVSTVVPIKPGQSTPAIDPSDLPTQEAQTSTTIELKPDAQEATPAEVATVTDEPTATSEAPDAQPTQEQPKAQQDPTPQVVPPLPQPEPMPEPTPTPTPQAKPVSAPTFTIKLPAQRTADEIKSTLTGATIAPAKATAVPIAQEAHSVPQKVQGIRTQATRSQRHTLPQTGETASPLLATAGALMASFAVGAFVFRKRGRHAK